MERVWIKSREYKRNGGGEWEEGEEGRREKRVRVKCEV